MKFFLDENFPKKAAPILESEGFQVFDIRGTQFEGKDDKWLFQKAQEHEAVFLTTDKDFFHTVPFLYESHYGVVVITLSQPDSIKILEKLRLALDVIKKHDIYSKCVRLTDHRIYLSENK
ncbi:MAG: hypothetical protein GTO45_22630 [Candidatus Aminicenantes bacterium]|nr:hypothetical protein [Candidatus Aminicenantes bacterium]NIM81561.1 hypothetical protein [Candidatus Aminicenantes bacterium]NIN20932.1 hypothetical protein [Candidatus Aminicenantes bacterium]NIN44753.1 hypothetical protein [Candidatus Aminicenantes bacterium]NIN87561.1 hypothetical protein [Candidatus Aminicenantes bacterium]